MENWSNSTHRASLKPKTQYTPPETKQYTYNGLPVEIVDSFSRGGKRIVVIETVDGDQFEIFMDQLG